MFGDIDCAVVDHPWAAATLPHDELDVRPLTLYPYEPVDAWRDEIDYRNEYSPCLVGRILVGDTTATMVFDLNLGWQDVVVPTAPSDLSHNSVLIERGPQGHTLRAGPQQERLTVGPVEPETCLAEIPTWSAETATGATVLAIEHHGTCTTLSLLGDQQLQVCDAPALPYTLGEDLDVVAGQTHLSVRTSSGGKPYLLGTSTGALPSWLAVDVFREDDYRTGDIHFPSCNVPDACGPSLPVDPIVSDGGPFTYAPWGRAVQVTDPIGSMRRFTVHSAGAPVDRNCELALVFSLVPAASNP